MRDGFRVLGAAIRRQPLIFSLSTAGSLLFGALTVADAWVLGWATDHVVLPAFHSGTTTSGALVAVLALFVGVAILRAVGIVARRLGAGVMQYRVQAAYRREVTRKYLSLPMSWHQQHPTGQLLSNANADVEAAFEPLAPLPMAVGTLAMMLIAVAQMFFADLVMALVGLLVFPLVMVANVIFQRVSSPVFTRIQALRAELSEIAHESFDGAMVVKTLGREGEETERFARKAQELRDEGYLPEALRNYMALLGWGSGDDETIFSTDDLVRQFSIERVSRNPAQFDHQKLRWLNGRYVRELPVDELTERLETFTGRGGLRAAAGAALPLPRPEQ